MNTIRVSNSLDPGQGPGILSRLIQPVCKGYQQMTIAKKVITEQDIERVNPHRSPQYSVSSEIFARTLSVTLKKISSGA